MNIEGNTYLFYDKYNGDHGYQNPKTVNITFNDLYNSDILPSVGKEAIKEFNKFGGIYKIDENIDTGFYELSFFVLEELKIMCVCVNHNKLKNSLQNIPNRNFLINCCSYHCAYTNSMKTNKNINELVKLIKLKSADANADPTDPIIEQPTFAKLNMFDYQKRTLNWLVETEKRNKKINYSFNDEVFFGDIVYDSVKKDFILVEDRKQIKFRGGLLGDEMGLGKTFEMISLSVLNDSKEISYFRNDDVCSRATLILSPNHLSNQWIREFKKTVKDEYDLKIVPLMTKVHFDKTTYLDILDADFVVVSYNFLGNECYFAEWISKISNSKKGQTYINSNAYNEEKAMEQITSVKAKLKENPNMLFDTKPLINCIKFHRIVIDEFHELLTLDKYSYILKLIKLFKAENKWVMTGTPFDKSDDCIGEMVNFLTDYNIQNINKVLINEAVQKYILTDFFRKNTKKSVENEYRLQPIVEEIIKLKFTPTERAMFNAYIANSNIDKRSVLVRQLCCDPRIVNELKDELSGCKTPEDIQKTMVSHYKKAMDNSSKKVRFIKYKIKKLKRNIKVTEFKRYRKFLRTNYKVTIEYPEKIIDSEFDNKNNTIDENIIDDVDIDDNIIVEEESDSDDDDSKPKITVSEDTEYEIIKIIKKQLNSNPSVTLNNMIDNLIKLENKLVEAEKQYQGKRTTSEFFTNMMNKINKIMQKKNNNDDSDNDEDEDDNDEDEMCSVCLNEITGDDVGVTKCGHMYCFQCIKEMVQSNPKCPQCMKPTTPNDITMISFEDFSAQQPTKEVKDKITLIAKIGTKLANLILYIKNCKEKCIVFSQWDDLLKKVGDVLDNYGIKNVFCRGNVWTRDKAIRDFTIKQDIQVIMLSSESAAAGTNLTAATKVILLEPVSGTYEFRKNTEGQAIGRAHRTGQTKQVSVVRFIIKDTIEEEIYNENIIEDAKFKKDVKMTMLTDDNINLSTDEIAKIATTAEEKIKIKESKPKKKVKEIVKKIIKKNNDSDLSDFSDEDY
jgi:SNF2 family DNA or RNA helicase